MLPSKTLPPESRQTQRPHVVADEEQMTVARTKQYEEEIHTGIRTDTKLPGKWRGGILLLSVCKSSN